MIDRLQFFSGYLRIKVWGFSPERFMNLCGSKGILLWDIEREGDVFFMNISLKNFYRLRPIARKTGVRAAILKRYGLPFYSRSVRHRKVFAAGVVLAAAFWFFSSFFVLDIVYDGNIGITGEMLDDYLASQKIRVGMRKSDLDIDSLEKGLRKEFPQITWVSAKQAGVRLKISLKENDAPIFESEDTGNAAVRKDILSQNDGVVVSILVRSGIPKVKAQDTVKTGDVLVEGLIPIYNDDQTVREYREVSADADVVIEHEMEYEDSLDFSYLDRAYTGREKHFYFFRIFGKEIRLPEQSPYLVYDNVIRLTRPKVFEILSVPVYFGENTCREYMNMEHLYDVSQAKEELVARINNYFDSLYEKGIQIIEKNVKIEHNDDKWVIRAKLKVQETVGAGG